MGQRIAAVGVEEESIAAAVERKRSRSESVVLGEVVERADGDAGSRRYDNRVGKRRPSIFILRTFAALNRLSDCRAAHV